MWLQLYICLIVFDRNWMKENLNKGIYAKSDC